MVRCVEICGHSTRDNAAKLAAEKQHVRIHQCTHLLEVGDDTVSKQATVPLPIDLIWDEMMGK
jgi:hypothetical protein